MICEKCGKEYEEDYRKDIKYKKVHPSRFCSRSCANSKEVSPELKRKISMALKTSEKAKAASLARVGKKGKRVPREEKICPHCGEIFKVVPSNTRVYCSEACWRVNVGGYREGSVRNYVHGRYKGYYYDSGWELIWIKWAIKNDIVFKRNTKGFEYEFRGEKHKYYPDFYLIEEDRYVEVKGIQDEQWEAKKKYFPYPLETIGKDEINILKMSIT